MQGRCLIKNSVKRIQQILEYCKITERNKLKTGLLISSYQLQWAFGNGKPGLLNEQVLRKIIEKNKSQLDIKVFENGIIVKSKASNVCPHMQK